MSGLGVREERGWPPCTFPWREVGELGRISQECAGSDHEFLIHGGSSFMVWSIWSHQSAWLVRLMQVSEKREKWDIRGRTSFNG